MKTVRFCPPEQKYFECKCSVHNAVISRFAYHVIGILELKIKLIIILLITFFKSEIVITYFKNTKSNV